MRHGGVDGAVIQHTPLLCKRMAIGTSRCNCLAVERSIVSGNGMRRFIVICPNYRVPYMNGDG